MAKHYAHEVAYSGTHGNVGAAIGAVNAAIADGDVIEFGKLPPGIAIKRVVAGTAKANASAVAEVKITKDDGTDVTLGTALDINNKMTAKDIPLVDVGFDQCLLTVTVSGGAVAADSNLSVYVEYVTLGTQ